MLVVFLVPITLFMHNFWGPMDPQMAMIQRALFFKNVSMLGGALIIAYFGTGPLSLCRPSRKK
jgi:putative oxidoreductase